MHRVFGNLFYFYFIYSLISDFGAILGLFFFFFLFPFFFPRNKTKGVISMPIPQMLQAKFVTEVCFYSYCYLFHVYHSCFFFFLILL